MWTWRVKRKEDIKKQTENRRKKILQFNRDMLILEQAHIIPGEKIGQQECATAELSCQAGKYKEQYFK